MEYPVIDAHQHFWNYNPVRDAWITDEMRVLKTDYLPSDFKRVMKQHRVSGSVLVQAESSENENNFLLDLARGNAFILGLVGWIDLESEKLEERLQYYQQFPPMKGFRYMLQDLNRRDKMLGREFQNGLRVLNKYGYSFDLLIRPDQVGFTEKLVKAFPEQLFVIDHLAKPFIKNRVISEWKSDIESFAGLQNVFCKISGLTTEADWEFWEEEDFRPYIDIVVETFGTKRIMFGSDWPVCLLAAEYGEVKQMVENYFNSFTLTEQADFFGGNANHFYRLT